MKKCIGVFLFSALSVFSLSGSAMAMGPNAVPDPAALLFLGIGLIGVVGIARKKLIKPNQEEEFKDES
jgi:hypothetical protein